MLVFYKISAILFIILVFFSVICYVVLFQHFIEEQHIFKQKQNYEIIPVHWFNLMSAEYSRIRNCHNAVCHFTGGDDPLKVQNAKAVLFYGSDMDNELPLPRPPKQIWALLHEESPKNIRYLSNPKFIQHFNLTSTMSRYSDNPLTLLYLPSLEALVDNTYYKTVAKKNNLAHASVLFIQTDCSTPTRREDYVSELMEFIPIDSYGSCLNNKQQPESIETDIKQELQLGTSMSGHNNKNSRYQNDANTILPDNGYVDEPMNSVANHNKTATLFTIQELDSTNESYPTNMDMEDYIDVKSEPILEEDPVNTMRRTVGGTAASSTNKASKVFKIKESQGWNDEKYLQLFALMEAEPCLWHKCHPHHSKRDVTDMAIKKIAAIIGYEVSEVQARWRSMRQTFFKYLQKEKLIKSGSAGGAKKKEWRFMSGLRFLQCEATDAGSTDNMFQNDGEFQTSNSESSTSEFSKEATPKRAKKRAAASQDVKVIYNKYLEELVSTKVDEYTEKGIEVGNVLRRVAKCNVDMAQKTYLKIRRILLEAEEALYNTTATTQVIQP